MSEFKYISLFSGIGGFESGLNSIGGKCVFASEIDKNARISYKAIHGDDELYGDITKIETQDINDHDMLVGGFPCQSFSINGKRKGLSDTRGTLFFQAIRIAEEKRPKIIFLENVTGLLNHDKGKTLDIMIQSLSEIGYMVDFDILNSSDFRVPQSRDRVYIIGIRKDLVEHEDWNLKKKSAVTRAKKRLTSAGDINTFNFNFPSGNKDKVELKDILEPNVDEKYYLDDKLMKVLTFKLEDEEGIAVRQATKKGYDVAYIGDAVNFVFPDSKTRRGRVGKKRANTLEASNINQGVVMEDYRIRKLTPLETWRLQGFSDDQFYAAKNAGMKDGELYKQSGNAVTVNVIKEIGLNLIKLLKKDSENT